MKNTKQKIGDLGQHWTPEDTVRIMVSLIENHGTILEPSSGSGRFLRALPTAIGVEIDESVVPSDLLDRTIIGSFFNLPLSEKYDTIIGNPPYVNGKLLTREWFGDWEPRLPVTANAYLHFIEKCLDHLVPGGELIFIVPAGLLSDTSKGAKLRERMVEEGAFTHVFDANELGVKWDQAAVDTIIFRWVRGEKQGRVKLHDGSSKALVSRNGFLWLTTFEVVGFFGDFFKATVGAAPHARAIEAGKQGDPLYARAGAEIPVSDNDSFKPWPRPRITKKGDKILFLGGPTRKSTKFWHHTTDRHIDHALLPLKKLDCKRLPKVLDAWFDLHGEDLGLIKAGRWGIGVKQFENCPFDAVLLKELTQIQKD